MRIAVIGDIHECWDAIDCEIIDDLGYDLVLFVGDLADRLHLRTLEVARRISKIRTPALLIPGNHDATTPLGVLAEGLHRGTSRPGAGQRAQRRWLALQDALAPVRIAEYSAHPHPEFGVTLIAARPHAMDGRRLSFRQALAARHDIRSMAGSISRLRELVDTAQGALVFLAHNGPIGLGSDREAPFALRSGVDIGDPDLGDAIAWAKRNDRQVLAVIAGHLHHCGTDRRWCTSEGGILYVNAARVPRIFERDGARVRHHIEVRLQAALGTASATEHVIAAVRGGP